MSKKIQMSELLEQAHDVADDYADTTAIEEKLKEKKTSLEDKS